MGFPRFGKEVLSLKRFMLRQEALKLYRDLLRIGRAIESNNPEPTLKPESYISNPEDKSTMTKGKILRDEWSSWVRSEFNIRKDVTEEDHIQQLLAQGRRQLKDMERTVAIAQNRNI